MGKKKSQASLSGTTWVQEMTKHQVSFVQYPHPERKEALLSSIFGDYQTIDKRMAEINSNIYQLFTFSSAETIFEALINYEMRHANRKTVTDLAALYIQQYFTGSMGPDTHKALENVVRYSPKKVQQN